MNKKDYQNYKNRIASEGFSVVSEGTGPTLGELFKKKYGMSLKEYQEKVQKKNNEKRK